MAGLISRWQQRKKQPPVCSAVIVAAGSARRMEGIDKILAPLGELPVLVHTLGVFQDCGGVEEIVVVTREDLLVEVSRLCRDYGMDKVTKVVVGGGERIHSVRAGLREVRPEAELIAIHDGARPLVTGEILLETIRRAAGYYESGEGTKLELYRKEDGTLGCREDGEEKAIIPVSPVSAIIRNPYSDLFLRLVQNEERGIYAISCGSRLIPRGEKTC